MESLMSSFLVAASATVFVILCFLRLLPFQARKDLNKTRKPPPEAAGGWPFIGHLLLLSGRTPLHITLTDMADKYGSIFSIRLGARCGLVVSSLEMAKECIKTNDVSFSNRPTIAATEIMGYNYALLGFAKYGPYWREIRKVSALNLLSNKKVSILGGARELEVGYLIRTLVDSVKKRKDDQAVDMTKIFEDLTLSLMVRTVAGDVEKKMGLKEKERWRELIREFFRLITVFTVSDVLPYLRWLDEKLGGIHKSFRNVRDEFDSMMQTWLQQHKIHRKTTDSDQEFDFMGEMLTISDSLTQEFPIYDADTINKATCGAMMVAGTDTMSVTLTWALCLLLNNPHTMKRAQDELDKHVGKSRRVRESDLENLVYIQAIIKETLRLQPPVPVIPREAAEDCVVAGYHIPAGTQLFVNAWKIQRDPLVWIDPLEFKPERFLANVNIDTQGFDYGFLGFGGGRRVCPGISLALQTTQLTLATLLHCFHLSTASGGAVDMVGSSSTVNSKATPVEVVLSSRLSVEIYA